MPDSPAALPRPLTIEPDAGDLALLAEQTAAFEASAAGLDDAALAEPSECDGWTRAHVVAHVAGNADAIANLAATLQGTPTPMYASRAARDAAIEEGARLPRTELLGRLTASDASLGGVLAGLDRSSTATAETPAGLVSAAQLPTLRLREVVYHHADLRVGFTLADAPTDLVRRLLADQVARVSAHPDCPPLDIRTNERDRFSLGDGTVTVSAPRAAMLAWLARGDASGIEAPAPSALPTLPDLEKPAS